MNSSLVHMDQSLVDLYKEAEKLAGRPVEVVGTVDGKYVVEWFSYGDTPPPKAPSELEALQGFVEKMLNRKLDPLILEAEVPKGDTDVDEGDRSSKR